MLSCAHKQTVFDNGYRICTNCGLQELYIETHILGYNERLNLPTKPYRREHRLKRLHSQIFGFTHVPTKLIFELNEQIRGIAYRPIEDTIDTLKHLISQRYPTLKRKLCSIYRQSGYKFKTVPCYENIKRIFRLIGECPIQSFNYLMYYITYFANIGVFREYRIFLKPQTKRLSKKNDSLFITYINTISELMRYIPVIGYKKIPHL